MSLPVPPNMTCDVYRFGTSPPAAPAVAGVRCYVRPSSRHLFNTGDSAGVYHTHLMLVPADTDVRDGWGANLPGPGVGTDPDSVFIPDKTSAVLYQVALVQRVARGTALDHKRVYLIRASVSWPSNDV
jgi:hypothetical protein